MRYDGEQLMRLLPAVYRIRDAESGQLRSLLEVIAGELAVLEEDLAQLYDDQFIDTCADWVVPYIGELLGNTPLYDGPRDADEQPRALFPDLLGPRFVPRVALRSRPDVARTIANRRRKATLPMLHELAVDVTGWTAVVVEMFQRLGWNQWIPNHIRPFNHACVDLRHRELTDRIGGPFDSSSHNVDLRPINQLDGWYEPRNIGFFLWRLRSYFLEDAEARQVSGQPHRFRVNRLGLDAPLFTRPLRAPDETEVPGPIRRSLLRDELRRNRATAKLDATGIYGPSFSLIAISAKNICATTLDPWPAHPPPGDLVAVDVANGRIELAASYPPAPKVRISYHYGFPGDVGGGPYPREGWLIKPGLAQKVYPVTTSLSAAVASWRSEKLKRAIIRIPDNHTYEETAEILLDPPADGWVAIEAAADHWPHIKANIVIACGGEDATVTLSGLLIEGNVTVRRLAGTLRLLHTTLAPATSAIKIDDAADLAAVDTFRLQMAFSISGSITLPPDGRGMTIIDSVVDGAIRGPSLHIERSTVFGSTAVEELPMASESIFTGAMSVVRRQEGCARFCFIPDGSRTPRRYRCQPDLEIATRIEREKAETAAARKAIHDAVVALLVPEFTSKTYPQPAYAQLHHNAPRQIATGAADGSEMGVWCHLKQPQREANLRARLGEYLPFGLVPGIIFVT
jgi:hypothetical protein